MAQTQSILATLFLVLTLFLEIQSIEGRHLKFEMKYDIPNLHSRLVSEKETKQIAGKSIDKTAYADEAVPSVPMTPMPPSQALGKTQSPPPPPPDHVVDFRPTTPGHSPGVGHSIQN